jgi:hypothetical protein
VGYAVEGDIRRHLGRYSVGWPPAGGQPPTVADGLAFADTAQGTLDAILNSKGIATPAAAPLSFVNLLRDGCAMYAAAHIIKDLNPQAAGPASTTDQDRLMGWYRDLLADLRKGDVIPSDMTLTASGRLGRSFWTSHPIDDDGVDITEPIFKRNKEQW